MCVYSRNSDVLDEVFYLQKEICFPFFNCQGLFQKKTYPLRRYSCLSYTVLILLCLHEWYLNMINIQMDVFLHLWLKPSSRKKLKTQDLYHTNGKRVFLEYQYKYDLNHTPVLCYNNGNVINITIPGIPPFIAHYI